MSGQILVGAKYAKSMSRPPPNKALQLNLVVRHTSENRLRGNREVFVVGEFFDAGKLVLDFGVFAGLSGAVTIAVRYLLTFTMLALLACGEGPGSGQDSIPGEVAETSRRDEVMNQAEQDRRVDYVEFLTTNIEETKKFYTEVFGWEFTDYGPEYTSFTDGRLGGGFALAPEVVTGGPLVVLYATNLEEIEASIRESGGRIVRDPFEFPGGRRLHFNDPSGNELAVWSDR